MLIILIYIICLHKEYGNIVKLSKNGTIGPTDTVNMNEFFNHNWFDIVGTVRPILTWKMGSLLTKCKVISAEQERYKFDVKNY
jgi:hypothetical protein